MTDGPAAPLEGRTLEDAGKPRSIQEYVPGKQVTLAHMIAHPGPELCRQIGVEDRGAIGLMTITPGEGAIIAADAAAKRGAVQLEFVDRFTGCLVFTGDVAAVDSALRGAAETLARVLGFSSEPVTRT
jgi:ethanolamine utilization protein EutS